MADQYVHGNRNEDLVRRSANRIVTIVNEILPVRSVLDVGCGLGYFCEAFLASGTPEVHGVDGDYVNRDQLLFPVERFTPANLEQPLDLGRTYDLVVCLEVAEHLPPAAAPTIVESLCRHGEAVLFSGATPQQGGQGHVNEQWIGYWASLFGAHGLHAYDLIRPRLLGDPAVQQWYQHNTVLFLTDAKAEQIGRSHFRLATDPVEYFLEGRIHPRLAWRALKASVKSKLKAKLLK